MKKKIIMITGGSSGLGRGTAEYLTSKGHIVILMSRNLKKLKEIATAISLNGGIVDFFEVDVRDRQSIEKAIHLTLKKYGRIDVFLSNAGIMPLSNILSYQLDEWNDLIETNLKGVLNTVSCVLPIFEKQNKGHFIYTSSTASKKITEGSTLYSALKACLNIVMEGIRREVAELDISICTIIPGTFRTNLYKSIKNSKFAKETYNREITIGLDPLEFAKSVEFIINQDSGAAINELVIRPIHQKN
ncbi:SDR family oxidoreductase [Enterococcus cecorum]|uniref:SDR family oxidoreductase n=1 Tax=Enterococcus cecorum TaxID=44008 RepID=UPI002ACAB0DD|nr:SDR family oxidoreductase [Enterococcus cecorum]MDZ5601015.1 SDR family oxidoreductase [Enterococcus cecorum]